MRVRTTVPTPPYSLVCAECGHEEGDLGLDEVLALLDAHESGNHAARLRPTTRHCRTCTCGDRS